MALNVIKGSYPSLVQNTTTKNVASAETISIVRGTLLKAVSGEWRVAVAADATAAPAPMLYFALQADTDLQGVMAGGGPTQNANVAISGLCVVPSCEFETDQYTGTPAAGADLTVGGDGVLGAAGAGDNVYAVCTSGPTTKWANEASAVAGWRTGAEISVIRAISLYIPAAGVA